MTLLNELLMKILSVIDAFSA